MSRASKQARLHFFVLSNFRVFVILFTACPSRELTMKPDHKNRNVRKHEKR